MLKSEDLVELVNCATQQDATPANVPFVGTDRDGLPSIVPVGEKWLIQSVSVNSVAGGDAYVWIVPDDRSVAASTVAWLVVPGVTVLAKTTETLESANDRPVRCMYPGDSFWVMGGGTGINVVVLGWRVSL